MPKNNLANHLLALFSLLLTAIIIALPVKAASSANVTATVTIQNISVSVSDGSVSYGTIATSETKDTTTHATTGVNDSQTATNDGNVTESLNIRSGTDPVGWTLGANAGSDIYTHKFCTITCDTTPTWTALTTNNQTLATGVTAAGTQVFDLQFGAPTSTTVFTEQSPTVIVQATI